ncbi:MAG: hypothetical protein KGI71_05965 [Patescibacteria group bacterium]|nr:hypothetical protein [Patescibacteria group bacterium]
MYEENEWIIVVIVSLVLLTAVAGLVSLPFILIMSPTSEGQHTGIITSIEKNGLFFHTWSAYVKTSAQSTQEDKYCVIDPAVIAQLQKYADSVTEVTVHYSNPLMVGVWNCQSNDESIITSVQ